MNLSLAAKKKRTYDRSNPTYKWVALAIVIMGAAAFVYGIYALTTHAGFGMYFLLFGLAAIFLFAGANVLPTSKNNRKYIENHFSDIKKYANVIEQRIDDSWCTIDSTLEDNDYYLDMCEKYNCNYILIDDCYQVEANL